MAEKLNLTDEEKRERLRTQKREYMRRYTAANREKKRISNQESYQRNRDKRLAKRKEWRENNPGYFKQVNADYYRRNLEKVSAVHKAYRDTHKDEQRILVAAWYLKNQDKVREYRKAYQPINAARNRQRATGCTPTQYLALLEQQDGRCAICGSLPGKYALAADHCHVGKVVRGLLCHKCNSGIGLFGDDVALLEAAIAYLKHHHPIAEGHNLGEGA